MEINYSYFFRPENFPWRLMGFDYPSYGPAHSYACKLMAPYAGQDGSYLRGNPTLFEMSRFPDSPIISDIYRHFKKLADEHDPYNVTPSAEQITSYLSTQAEFKTDMAKRLIEAHKKGDKIPKAGVYYSPKDQEY